MKDNHEKKETMCKNQTKRTIMSCLEKDDRTTSQRERIESIVKNPAPYHF